MIASHDPDSDELEVSEEVLGGSVVSDQIRLTKKEPSAEIEEWLAGRVDQGARRRALSGADSLKHAPAIVCAALLR